MPESALGEIRLHAGPTLPHGWAYCDGQLLEIASHRLLYTLLGTTYGGDGRTTFALPDLRGRVPMHVGQGPGLTARRAGQRGGSAAVPLSEAQLPQHSHTLRGVDFPANSGEPEAGVIAQAGTGGHLFSRAPSVNMSDRAIHSSGGTKAHNNLQPLLGLHFVIATEAH